MSRNKENYSKKHFMMLDIETKIKQLKGSSVLTPSGPLGYFINFYMKNGVKVLQSAAEG